MAMAIMMRVTVVMIRATFMVMVAERDVVGMGMVAVREAHPR